MFLNLRMCSDAEDRGAANLNSTDLNKLNVGMDLLQITERSSRLCRLKTTTTATILNLCGIRLVLSRRGARSCTDRLLLLRLLDPYLQGNRILRPITGAFDQVYHGHRQGKVG